MFVLIYTRDRLRGIRDCIKGGTLKFKVSA
jgi:hypothetical protein